MRKAVNIKQLVTPVLGLLIAVAAGTALPAPVFAQQSATNAPDANEGQVIYSRNVPYGTAIGPRTPGQANTVVTGPTSLILHSVATGLEPITDDENAGIAAATSSQASLIGSHVMNGMSALSNVGSSGAASTITAGQGSATSGAISQATGALSAAINSLRGVLGTGQ